MKYTVENTLSLLEAMQKMQPTCSNNKLRTLIKDGRVLIDDHVAKQIIDVEPNQTIEIIEKRIKKQGPLDIIYEDPHFIVINKPSGLLSVKTNFEQQKTAHAILKRRYPKKKVFVVHRLDQETSGVMLFALTEQAYHCIKSELAGHKIGRIYYALVEGILEGKGRWQSYLWEDKAYYMHVVTDPLIGEKAVTHYFAEKHLKGNTVVRFELETGKKNQIRVQSAAAGHPIVGDIKYGAKSNIHGRLCLHAAELVFHHPITKQKMLFKAPLPQLFGSSISR